MSALLLGVFQGSRAGLKVLLQNPVIPTGWFRLDGLMERSIWARKHSAKKKKVRNTIPDINKETTFLFFPQKP